jgi:aminotransferase
MKISKKAQATESSLTRQLFNMAQGFTDVIDLTLGDPDVKPAEGIRKAACDAINNGKTRYSANAGLIQLRKVISKHLEREYNISVNPDSEIVVTVGGMEALYLALSSVIDEGDEIIVLAPYYVNYVQMTNMCGGKPVVINSTEENNFAATMEQIENAITERTVAIVLNTPCNPTGVVLDDTTIDMICDVAKKYNLTVISDEVYSSLIYDGKKHSSVITRDGMKERTILIDSISKRFSMTGYRLGYATGPAEIISCMTKMQENIAACAPLPSQHASIEAYNSFAEDTSLRDIFLKRRDYIYPAINSIDKLSCNKPEGTFYLFVNISKTGMDSFTFCKELLLNAHVAVAPGITYGKEYDNYVRLAYTLEIPKLEEGVQRIKTFVEGL